MEPQGSGFQDHFKPYITILEGRVFRPNSTSVFALVSQGHGAITDGHSVVAPGVVPFCALLARAFVQAPLSNHCTSLGMSKSGMDDGRCPSSIPLSETRVRIGERRSWWGRGAVNGDCGGTVRGKGLLGGERRSWWGRRDAAMGQGVREENGGVARSGDGLW